MRTIVLVTFIALAAASAAFAQSNSGGNGTNPQNEGATGRTGGHPEVGGSTAGMTDQAPRNGQGSNQTTGLGSNSQADAKAAADQPLMATGEDLNGPPVRFPPDQTPE